MGSRAGSGANALPPLLLERAGVLLLEDGEAAKGLLLLLLPRDRAAGDCAGRPCG